MDKWTRVEDELPYCQSVTEFDVTIEEPLGSRMLRLALFWPTDKRWELVYDKHNYQDCKIIAWAPRRKIYKDK